VGGGRLVVRGELAIEAKWQMGEIKRAFDFSNKK
jgi:hypothetical protein